MRTLCSDTLWAEQARLCTIGLTMNVHVVHIDHMTTLDTWMANSRDDHWLAALLGCSRSQASRIRRGKSRPSPQAAFQIEAVTVGAVKAADLLSAGPDGSAQLDPVGAGEDAHSVSSNSRSIRTAPEQGSL